MKKLLLFVLSLLSSFLFSMQKENCPGEESRIKSLLREYGKELSRNDNPLANFMGEDYSRLLSAINQDGAVPPELITNKDLLFAAVCQNDEWVVQNMLDCGANKEARGHLERTPLHEAAKHCYPNLVRLFLSRNCDKEKKDWGVKHTPLSLAIDIDVPENDEKHQRQIETVQELIDAGADVNVQLSDGETPLHLALLWGCREVALALLKAKANANLETYTNQTPLHIEAFWGRTGLGQELIDAGATVDAKNFLEETPLHTCWKGGNWKNIMGPLLAAGADPNSQNPDGLTPLHSAAKRGCLNEVERFLETGGKAYIKDKDGDTPISLAAREGHIKVLQSLVTALKKNPPRAFKQKVCDFCCKNAAFLRASKPICI